MLLCQLHPQGFKNTPSTYQPDGQDSIMKSENRTIVRWHVDISIRFQIHQAVRSEECCCRNRARVRSATVRIWTAWSLCSTGRYRSTFVSGNMRTLVAEAGISAKISNGIHIILWHAIIFLCLRYLFLCDAIICICLRYSLLASEPFYHKQLYYVDSEAGFGLHLHICVHMGGLIDLNM